MTILDGKVTAAEVKNEVREKASALREKGILPGLAVVLVGNNPASEVYVRLKEKDCSECGIQSYPYHLPADYGEENLIRLIEELNARREIHGILVQLPLPQGYDERKVIFAIDPEKDVDCFHPVNVGKLYTGYKRFVPCTPGGVMVLLKKYNVPIVGKKAVVIGRSNIVGKPMAMLLTEANATVTLAHSRTENLQEYTKDADIIVAAVGKRHILTADMVKPGACVVDVGMNRTEDGHLTGDVDYDDIAPKAGWITPVPGGVGPMTRAMLMKNTIDAAWDAQ